MNNYKKLGLIAGQVIFGLLFGLAGFIVPAFLVVLYYESIGVTLDLFPTLAIAVIGGYIVMFVGIAYDGYSFLKENGKQKYFSKFFVQSLIGFVIGIIGFYFLISYPNRFRLSQSLLNFLVNCLAVVLPLICSIIGFDFKLNKVIIDK